MQVAKFKEIKKMEKLRSYFKSVIIKLKTHFREIWVTPVVLHHRNFFDFPIKLLNCVGFDLKGGPKKMFCFTVINMVLAGTIIILELTHEPTDLQKIVFAVSTALQVISILLKVHRTSQNRREIVEIVDMFAKFYPKPISERCGYSFRKFKILKVVTICAIIVIGTGAFSIPFLYYFIFGKLNLILPFPSFLIDPNTSFYIFSICYIHQLITIVWCVLLSFGFEVLYFTLTLTLVLEFYKIGEDYRELKYETSEELIDREISKLVNRQNQLCELLRKLDDIISPYHLIFTVNSFIIVGFLAFVLVSAPSATQYLMDCILFGVVVIFESFLIGVFAQFLLNSLEFVADSVYDCGWECFEDNRMRKNILLILRNSQRIKGFSLMGFGEISCELIETVRKN